ncbi:hypothetical protein EMIT0194P_20331 [Pseudomonas serbica]
MPRAARHLNQRLILEEKRKCAVTVFAGYSGHNKTVTGKTDDYPASAPPPLRRDAHRDRFQESYCRLRARQRPGNV